MSRGFCYALALFVFVAYQSAAQHPAFINYKVKDGLPSSQVYQVLQDSRGYIWFATDGGACRFDGYNFKTFTTEQGLANNTVFEIYEDRKGRIWFRTLSGKFSYFFNDSIYNIGANEKLSKILGVSLTTSFYIDSAGTLWVGAHYAESYYKIKPPYGSEDIIPISVPGCYYLINGNANDPVIFGSVQCAENQTSYLYHNNRFVDTLLRFDMKGSGQSGFRGLRLNNGNYIYCMFRKIALFNDKQLLYKYDLGKRIICLEQDKSHNLWVGFNNQGVWFYEKGNLKSKPVKYFEGESITGVLEDKEGSYWFTTLSNGVFYMPSRTISEITGRTGLSHDYATSLIELGTKDVLAGFANGDLIVLSEKGVKKTIAFDYWISYIHRWKNDLLVGTAGIWKINNSLTKKEKLKVTKSTMYITCLIPEKNDILFGTSSHVSRLSDSTYKIDAHVRITALAEHNGTIYIGTPGCLMTARGNLLRKDLKNPLFKNYITDIKVSSMGHIWVATKGAGILIINGNKVHQISTDDGLVSNFVRTVFPENNNLYWAGTSNGLSKIMLDNGDLNKFRIENYNTNSGLSSNEVNQIIKTATGKIWLATTGGVNFFNPGDILLNKIAPPVYITRLQLNKKSAPLQESHVFEHNQNYISISYIGLCYKAVGKLKYRYKMEGIDQDWRITTATSIQYPTLSPGSYKFLVSACNNDGVWNDQPASVSFVIKPAFWQTWWFILLVIFFTAGFIAALFITRLKKVRRQELEKAEIKQQIANLELKALRSQMNPHFIFNSINSIQNFVLNNEPDEAYDYFVKFSRLIRNVLENSKNETITLAKELETLKLYIELEALRFEEAFEYRQEVDESIEISSVYIPSMIVQPFVENAIWHGLMPKKSKGLIRLRVEKDINELRFIIEDNGVGRKYAETHKIKGHESLGLMITHERLNIWNRINKTNLTISIIDLADADTPAGTRVILSIPTNNDYDKNNNC